MNKNISYPAIVGVLIKEEREKRSLTQGDLAKFGLPQSTIARIELGEAVTIPNILAICWFLDIDMADVFIQADRRKKALADQGYLVFVDMDRRERKNGKWMYGDELSRVSQVAVSIYDNDIVVPGITR